MKVCEFSLALITFSLLIFCLTALPVHGQDEELEMGALNNGEEDAFLNQNLRL